MPGGIAARALGGGEGWSASEFVCSLGPQDRPFEERHEAASVAVVLDGAFQYRGSAGRALLHPGALMLGNPGACYECGHEHGTGDRCVAFQFAPAYFEEAAEGRRFAAPMLPGLGTLVPGVVEAEARAAGGGALALEELGLLLLLGALEASGAAQPDRPPSMRDERRILDALRHIEANAGRELDLAELAGVAGMSKHHFLRTFRRVAGLTPYRHLLGVRLKRAAARLRSTAEPVAAIAFDAGFGDLSTFNHRFRAVFGRTPTAFRRAAGG